MALRLCPEGPPMTNELIYLQKMKVWLELVGNGEIKLAQIIRQEMGDLFFDPAMPSISTFYRPS
jgi:hypothetical protein